MSAGTRRRSQDNNGTSRWGTTMRRAGRGDARLAAPVVLTRDAFHEEENRGITLHVILFSELSLDGGVHLCDEHVRIEGLHGGRGLAVGRRQRLAMTAPERVEGGVSDGG